MNFRNLEDNGFIKFDFLGLTLLKDVENCIKRILTRETGIEPTFLEIRDWFDKHLNCRYVDQDDPEGVAACISSAQESRCLPVYS